MVAASPPAAVVGGALVLVLALALAAGFLGVETVPAAAEEALLVADRAPLLVFLVLAPPARAAVGDMKCGTDPPPLPLLPLLDFAVVAVLFVVVVFFFFDLAFGVDVAVGPVLALAAAVGDMKCGVDDGMVCVCFCAVLGPGDGRAIDAMIFNQLNLR